MAPTKIRTSACGTSDNETRKWKAEDTYKATEIRAA